MAECPTFLRRWIAICVCAATAALLPLSGQAPGGRMAFKAYGPAQGLGSSTNWDLVQDRSGFVWIASSVGLFRYDGNHFKLFGIKDGLPTHFIWCLHQGADGTLWVGTYKGLARLKENGFEAVPLGSPGAQPEVPRIVSGPEGRIWAATSNGLFSQDGAGHFQPVPGWPGGSATALWGRPDSGRVWAASWLDARARIFSWEKGAWKEYPATHEGNGARIDALAVDGDGAVWARSLKSLCRLDPRRGEFLPAVPGVPPASERGHLYVDKAGCLWVTTLKGLVRFAKDGPHWITPADGLPDVSVTALTEDHEGTLWVAGAGLFHLQGRGAWRSYPRSTGLPAGPVWCVFRDVDGHLYAGTDRGLYRAAQETWSVIPGTEGMQVRSAAQGTDKAIYMAGSPEVVRWDPSRGTLTHYGPADGVVTGGRIYRLLLDRDDALWVATDKGGLLKGTSSHGRRAFLRVEVPGGGPQENVNDLRLDSAGRLWASGDQGLLVLDAGTWHRFTTADGLRENHVSYIRPMRNGDLVFSYFEPRGVARARYEAGRLRILKHLDDTLPVEKVVYIVGEDSKDNFWVGTGQGVDRIDAANQVEHFGYGDGLFCEDTNSMAFLADPGGDVWIGTNLGLARFDAVLDAGMPGPPSCVLLSSRLGGGSIQSAKRPTAGSLPRTSSRNSTFESEFSALTFVKEDDIHYQTRLVGLEPAWHDTGSREVRYPALPPGSYRFEVRARVGRGTWGQPAAIGFVVVPSWWQSWWFRGLVILGTAGLAALGFWIRVAALNRRNRLLKAMVDARTQELAKANEQLNNLSLTDPLTGLRNRRFLGLSMPDDVARVNRVHRTAALHGPERSVVNVDMIFIMVDLDHFKIVNDQHGHAAGDQVLQEIAEILRTATRDTDTLVRWGGEEFLVVARNACRDDATLLVDRILAQVEAHVFKLEDGTDLRCTCSLGFTVYPLVHETPDLLPWERLLDLADHCLYAAKRGGRNAWVGLYPGIPMDAKILRARIPAEIEALIREGHLEAKTSLPETVALLWHGNSD